ncbi:MAG TPA: RtcB family protein, partial [Pseudonocardia sp.]|nr:RtcB family protein [Pseudonocardia sp.]
MDLIPETPYRWRLDPVGAMRVPGVVFATRSLLPEAPGDRSLEQVANVATLPGIVVASYAMPDVHWGYGFPIGGVAATDVDDGGVVSPGGVGFDISCGVRLLVSPLNEGEVRPRLGALMDELDRHVPRGAGPGAVWHLPDGLADLDEILRGGSRYAVERGHGVPRDVEHCEDRGAVGDAEPERVGLRARQRGVRQVGSLGSGNHFLEVQVVEEVHDPATADAFGLR